VATGAIRDLDGFESVVQAALDDLASIHQQYFQSGREEWRAIEDGERDYAVEEAMQWNHEGDGYTSGVFIDAYIRQLRAEGRWPVLANHPRVAELVRGWSQALETSPGPVDEAELRAILAAGKGMDNEPNVWAALRKHWRPALEPSLGARIGSVPSACDLRDELALTAVKMAPNALPPAFQENSELPDRQVTLLTAMQRARRRLGMNGRANLRRITGALPNELREIFNALPTRKRKARAVNGPALSLLAGCAPQLDAETLDLVVPVIIESGGNASPAISQWLMIASRPEHAVNSTKAAIAIGDTALVQAALRHQRADARRVALLHLASTFPDPLPHEILAMAFDRGSRVRRALVALLGERPHPDHVETLLALIHDTWSSAEPNHDQPESFDIAREAVVALAANGPLSDAIGDTLINLADTTLDRTLSQYALIAAARCCSSGIQQKIYNLVNIPEVRWIRMDALDVLANADSVDASIVARLTPAFLLNSPEILAAPAAHLVGAHAFAEDALKLFELVSSSNKRRALLLVGANAMARRDRTTADRILDLLEPGHLGRQLLAAADPLPASILDDLGSVQLREAVRKQLGDRLAFA